LGSPHLSRTELHLNQILRPKVLGLAIAAVSQENNGWRTPDFQDKRRLFATLTFTPVTRLVVRAMAERGNEYRAVVAPFTASDSVLAWLDNRTARGVDAVTVAPTSAAPTAAQIALGITGRNGTATAATRRYIWVENTASVFDSAGAYITGSYNNPAVRAPDGTPGVSGDAMRINDPASLPYEINAAGPGMFRDQNFANFTLTADWRVTSNLNVNLSHNDQKTDLTNPVLGGASPAIAGEPNRTLGVNGPANPYAGQLYIDAGWGNSVHVAKYRETRLSFSYDLVPRWSWLGTHRLAGMYARSWDEDRYVAQRLGFAGAPFNADPNNANNALNTRVYFDGKNPNLFSASDWRQVPKSLVVAGRSYDVAWIDDAAGTNNSLARQKLATRLLVAQSHFWKRRIVTTVGYREDAADVTTFGYAKDPILRTDLIDADPAKATLDTFRGITRTQGLVFHATSQVSLIANRSSNIGIPTFKNRVLPNGTAPDPSKGEGEDYGLSFDLFSNRASLKVVYFTTTQLGQTGSGGINARYNLPNIRIADAFESVLVGAGRPLTAAAWAPLRQSITPTVNAQMFDENSSGYEATFVANPTPRWRVTANYSYTDRIRSNSGGRDVIPWYGFKLDGKFITEGVTQNANGTFAVNPAAFVAGQTVAKWIELGALRPEAALGTLTTSSAITVAEELRNMISALNDDKLQGEQRWGLRPHKVSVFNAYDFTTGRLKGCTVGGGYRWRSANIIGRDAAGKEITGRVLSAADLMARYRHPVRAGNFRGTLSYQLNVTNLFNQDGLLPQRFSSTNTFMVPGGRGVGYSRFDLLEPRSTRFTTTFSY
jgi:hypothetical protein